MSLKRALAALATTAPEELDPEQSLDSEHTNFAPSSVSGALPTGQRSKLRAAAASASLEEDPRYAGKVVNRKSLRASQGFFDESEQEEEEEASDSGEEEEEELPARGKRAPARAAKRVETDSSEEEEEGARLAGSSSGSGLVADVDAQLLALEQADAVAVAKYKQAADGDMRKGEHVQQQLNLQDAFLRSRITLQKPLLAANQLPIGEGTLARLAGAEPFTETRQELTFLLCDLLQLREELISRLPTVAVHATAEMLPAGLSSLAKLTGRKRARSEMSGEGQLLDQEQRQEQVQRLCSSSSSVSEQLWPSLEAQWKAIGPYRDGMLDQWARKLTYAHGITAKQASKLKVLSSDMSAQVDTLLKQEGSKLRSRSRPTASTCKVLGSSAALLPACTDSEGRFTEGYDDSELYTSLLKELLATGDAALHHDSSLAGLANKNKRVRREGIDRRATKGRRIKYVVHPKLLNFMTATPYVVPPDMAYDLNTLTSSLFQSN